MKKIILMGALALSFTMHGQDFHRCYTQEAMEIQETLTPGYIDRVNETFERAKLVGTQNREEVLTIPVVVHVVYNTAAENIPDSVIYNQIDILNADFRRTNEDAVNVRDTFNSIVGDTYIDFRLATVDPEGNPTTGITRTNTAVTSFLDFAPLAEGVKHTADGGVDAWDKSRYLNIWVCDMSYFGDVFLLGYATPPDGLDHWPPGAIDGMDDGVVVQYHCFGSNNPNTLMIGGVARDVYGRTLTHEVGHYLGLRHIWGDGGCGEQDGIDDTPNMSSESPQDCDLVKNTCVDDIGDLGDLPDMVENYMDYSAETCQNSFTIGQGNLMRSVIENFREGLIDDNPAVGLGIEEQQDSPFEIELFPNPSSNGQVTISISAIDVHSDVLVYSETGQLIKALTLNGGSDELVIGDLAPGLYFVNVSNEVGLRIEKLIVH